MRRTEKKKLTDMTVCFDLDSTTGFFHHTAMLGFTVGAVFTVSS